MAPEAPGPALGADGALPRLSAGGLGGAGGKLRAFGRDWAAGRLSDDGDDEAARIAEDCARFGLLPPPEAPPPDGGGIRGGGIRGGGIWADCLAAARAFLVVQTQWRVAGSGAAVGLDYAGVAAGLAAEELALDAQGWRDLRAIEAGAVEEMNRALRAAEGGRGA